MSLKDIQGLTSSVTDTKAIHLDFETSFKEMTPSVPTIFASDVGNIHSSVSATSSNGSLITDPWRINDIPGPFKDLRETPPDLATFSKVDFVMGYIPVRPA